MLRVAIEELGADEAERAVLWAGARGIPGLERAIVGAWTSAADGHADPREGAHHRGLHLASEAHRARAVDARRDGRDREATIHGQIAEKIEAKIEAMR
jgi:hypothetical protein